MMFVFEIKDMDCTVCISLLILQFVRIYWVHMFVGTMVSGNTDSLNYAYNDKLAT